MNSSITAIKSASGLNVRVIYKSFPEGVSRSFHWMHDYNQSEYLEIVDKYEEEGLRLLIVSEDGGKFAAVMVSDSEFKKYKKLIRKVWPE